MAFEALFPFTRIHVFRWLRVAPEIPETPAFHMLECSGRVYDETTFGHCLRREQQRAASSGLPLLLLLIGVRPDPAGKSPYMSRSLASKVFDAVERCTRDLDSVGWYRGGRVAGAVLPQGSDDVSSNAGSIVAARIKHALSRGLAPADAKRLRVRVVHLGSRPGNSARRTRANGPAASRPALLPARVGQAQRGRPLILGPNLFQDVLARECRRAERFNQPFTLVVVALEPGARRGSAAQRVLKVLSRAKRETDVLGWLHPASTCGVILRDHTSPLRGSGSNAADEIRAALEVERNDLAAPCSIAVHRYEFSRHTAAAAQLTSVNAIGIVRRGKSRRFQQEATLPASPTQVTPGFGPPAPTLHPRRAIRVSVAVKRLLDVVLSVVLLVSATPLLALIALLIKLKSPGPILFRQERVGRMGKAFTMLKFRTMHVNSDPSLHQEFVREYIDGAKPARASTGTDTAFKIADDPRVTSIGRILRRSSLDELPQLWNVIRGDMSLVGPRPPLAYEVERYKHWHYRRLLEAKPGITGLWQVTGRSRTTFDDKVRLDLRYAKNASVWTDIKILLATPRAVLSAEGAR